MFCWGPLTIGPKRSPSPSLLPPSHLDSSPSPPPPPLPGELPSLRCRLLHRVKVESWLTLSFISDCITALEHHLQLMWIILPETILICFCYELLPWLLMLMTGACFILTFDQIPSVNLVQQDMQKQWTFARIWRNPCAFFFTRSVSIYLQACTGFINSFNVHNSNLQLLIFGN